MSLETHTISSEFIEAVSAIPDTQFGNGGHARAVEYLSSLGLTTLSIQYDQPLVLKLDDTSIELLARSFARPTPLQVPKPALQPVDTFELLQLAVATSIGQPLSRPDIRKGAIVQDIIPTENNRFVPSSSYGSEAEFAFHNDLSFLDDQEIPDYFTLGCIRNTEGAATPVASAEQILDRLSQTDESELRNPSYAIRHTYHRGLANEYIGTRNTAIILANDELRLGVDVVPLTPEAGMALRSLHRLLRQIATSHTLQPGEIMLVPNRFAVHARDSFVPAPDPSTRRWLQRIHIRADVNDKL